GNDRTLQLWGGSPRTNQYTFYEVANAADGFAFHPRKPILALACGDVRFRDLRTGASLSLLMNAPTHGVRSVAFSGDGTWIALGFTNDQVSIWNLGNGQLSHCFHSHSKFINALCFSEDGLFLASGDWVGLVMLYDIRRRLAWSLEGHKG